MSIKIYVGYRIYNRNLRKFTRWFDAAMIRSASRTISAACDRLTMDKDRSKADPITFPAGTTEAEEKRFRGTVALFAVSMDAHKHKIAQLNFDSGFNMWPDEDCIYIIPYFPCGNVHVKPPDYVDDYSYWTSTDRPENVPEDMWRLRGRVWDRVCLNDWNKNRFYHTTLEASTDMVGFDKLEAAIQKLGPWPKWGDRLLACAKWFALSAYCKHSSKTESQKA